VYSNAGHPHAFALHRDGTHERLGATDPPVGFAGPTSYGEESIAWNSKDDLLLLFTDGLPDTLGTSGRLSGEELIIETAVRHRFRTPSEIIDTLFELSTDGDRSAALGDDRTALVVRV
jgi:serine phosphatase RsbU (regulator of sigma subunit)